LNKKLHIVSFDVPFPPNYGGVIDVFYKLKALHKLGVKIYLHTFEYGRGKSIELEEYCEKVSYYPRKKSILNIFSKTPFIVCTRRNKNLVANLKKDNNPILFEGLHTTFPLIKNDFKNRTLLVRSHNIEHRYYDGLAKSEKNGFKKMFFKTESRKLNSYEKILNKVNYILTISPYEQTYFETKYDKKATYIPVFHENNKVKKLSNKGNFALYHGDLRVSDNLKAASYLIDVFKDINYKFIIASSYKNKELSTKISEAKNIHFELLDSKNQSQLEKLFENAHINVLPTFQKTGIKLKLIHALFASRFCVVNNEMVEDTGLEKLCEVAQSKNEFKEKVLVTITKNYSDKEIAYKKKALQSFNTLNNAKKISELI
jgi:hypothetical protein